MWRRIARHYRDAAVGDAAVGVRYSGRWQGMARTAHKCAHRAEQCGALAHSKDGRCGRLKRTRWHQGAPFIRNTRGAAGKRSLTKYDNDSPLCNPRAALPSYRNQGFDGHSRARVTGNATACRPFCDPPSSQCTRPRTPSECKCCHLPISLPLELIGLKSSRRSPMIAIAARRLDKPGLAVSIEDLKRDRKRIGA